MPAMESTVIRFAERRAKDNRISRVMDARRRLAADVQSQPERNTGRVWLNGMEIGGTDRRFAHLHVFHD